MGRLCAPYLDPPGARQSLNPFGRGALPGLSGRRSTAGIARGGDQQALQLERFPDVPFFNSAASVLRDGSILAPSAISIPWECRYSDDSERNAHFRDHPRRAGGKVWGKEPASCKFSEFNNC